MMNAFAKAGISVIQRFINNGFKGSTAMLQQNVLVINIFQLEMGIFQNKEYTQPRRDLAVTSKWNTAWCI